jgi:hypothetical protein
MQKARGAVSPIARGLLIRPNPALEARQARAVSLTLAETWPVQDLLQLPQRSGAPPRPGLRQTIPSPADGAFEEAAGRLFSALTLLHNHYVAGSKTLRRWRDRNP